jgi:hypothetical protein
MTTTNFSTPRDLLRYAVTRFNAAKLFFGHGSAEASWMRACCRMRCCRCWP